MEPVRAAVTRDIVMPSLMLEHRVTRRVIEAIPIDQSDFRPDAIAKTAIDLAWHIVSAEHRFMSAVVTGAFDFANPGRPDSLRTSADVAAWYGETFPKDAEQLGTLTGEHLATILDFRGIFQLPAVSYLQFVMSHSIHHRGQLSTYLRPMGAKVPAIYGESYDSAQAKSARP